MRARAARALVRWVSGWIGTAYEAYCHGQCEIEAKAAWVARRAQKIAFPIARRLDRNAMTEQMVNEGWWG